MFAGQHTINKHAYVRVYQVGTCPGQTPHALIAIKVRPLVSVDVRMMSWRGPSAGSR